jgi:hypothetical protein
VERAELLELAYLLWGEETEAEARVDTVGRHRDPDTAVRALLRTRTPSVVAPARAAPWWLGPEQVRRGDRVAAVLAALPLPARAGVVLVGLGLADPAELPARFGVPVADPAVLGPDPQAALADRLAGRRPPARDDDAAAAEQQALRRRRRIQVGGAVAAVAVLGLVAWQLPRGGDAPDARPTAATATATSAPVARLVSVLPGQTPVSLAAEVAAEAAGGADAQVSTVWTGTFDTGVAGTVDAVVVRVVLPDGTTLSSTAFAQGRENQTFLVAPCGVQPAAAVTAARCTTADPGTGTSATTVLVTGLTAQATLLTSDDVPLATLTPDAAGTTTVRDDAGAGTTVRLADGTQVSVAGP